MHLVILHQEVAVALLVEEEQVDIPFVPARGEAASRQRRKEARRVATGAADSESESDWQQVHHGRRRNKHSRLCFPQDARGYHLTSAQLVISVFVNCFDEHSLALIFNIR